MDLNNQTTKKLLIAAGALVVTTAIGLTVFFLTKDSSIEVPNFKNRNISDVNAWIEKEKIKKEQVKFDYKYDDVILEETIMNQSIEAGERLNKKDFLILTVSKGVDYEKEIEVPDFSKMKKEDIQKFFSDNLFKDVTFEYKVDKEIPRDGFIKINKTGNKLKRSDVIVVTISVGETNIGIEIKMPNLKEYGIKKAKAWAEENNITLKIKEVYSDNDEAGTIIAQSVDSNTTIKTGDTVEITVSLGRLVMIPELKGKIKAEVEKWAKNNDLYVKYESYYSDEDAKGAVISTYPKKGKGLKEGSTLTVYLSLGQIFMGDLVGKKEADIKKFIDDVNANIYDKANHIGYSVKEDDTTDKPAGTIIKTDPAKNRAINLGSKITITVAVAKPIKVESKSNITLSELEKYLVGLDMKLGNKFNEVYHDTIEPGKVVRNDSGTFTKGHIVNYVTSLGKYSPTNATFDGKNSDEVEKILKEARDKEAGKWSSILVESYSDTIEKGKTFGCSVDVDKKQVACSVSKGVKPKPVEVGSFEGKSLSEFTNFISSNGLKLGNKTEEYNESIPAGHIIRNSTGSLNVGSSVDYTVSLGAKPMNKISDAQVAALSNCVSVNNPETTKANIIDYIVNTLGFATPNVIIEENDKIAGDIISTGSFAVGTFEPSTVFEFKVSKGPGLA